MIFRTRFKHFQIEVELCFNFDLTTLAIPLVLKVKRLQASFLKSKIQEVLQRGCNIQNICCPMLFMKFQLACWIPALYFFRETDKSTNVTPAQSRNLNVECIWGDLYDHHDIWHFFSAAGLFFSFILLLVFDDGIDHVPRNRIFIF